MGHAAVESRLHHGGVICAWLIATFQHLSLLLEQCSHSINIWMNGCVAPKLCVWVCLSIFTLRANIISIFTDVGFSDVWCDDRWDHHILPHTCLPSFSPVELVKAYISFPTFLFGLIPDGEVSSLEWLQFKETFFPYSSWCRHTHFSLLKMIALHLGLM